MEELKHEVDLFDIEDDDMSVFDDEKHNLDGIYRPSLENAKDKSKGYQATIRFLPNYYKGEDDVIKKGPISIKKHVHYANIAGDADLTGYYECNKNFEPKCDLCTIFWKLHESKNEADVEKSKLINRSTKWYSYVYIIEDENNKELEGKILVFPYGAQVREKIRQQKNGEAGSKCKVFSLTTGKDFRLIIKSKGSSREKVTYESSLFLDTSPVKLYNESKKSWITIPVDENGKISPSAQNKLLKLLLDRNSDLNSHEPKVWSDETKSKVKKIIAYLTGNDVFVAEQQATHSSPETSSKFENSAPENTQTAEDFFSIDDDA